MIFLICSSYIVPFDLTVADCARTALGVSPSEGQERGLTLHTSVPIGQKLVTSQSPTPGTLALCFQILVSSGVVILGVFLRHTKNAKISLT